MKKPILSLILAAGAAPTLVVSLLAHGQEIGPPRGDGQGRVETTAEPMEEITVVAPPSLRSLHREFLAAQEVAFDMFNGLNDDNDFDIVCRRERPPKDAWNPIPNSWPTRVCSTPFVDRVTRNETQDALNGDGFFGDSAVDVQRHVEELVRRVSEATVENPEFLQAMLRYRDAKSNYDEERSDQMANSGFNSFFSRLFGSNDEAE